MKKLSIILVVIACLLIIAQLYIIDFDNLVSKSNMGSYLGIACMIVLIYMNVRK